jgi:NTE family protein
MEPTPITPPASSRRERVAVVIGSGGIKCAAALGLWRVLEREDIDIDLIVGCSGGSMYAAAMALGLSIDEAEAMTKRLWTREVMMKRDNRSILAALLPKLFNFDGTFGMVDDRPAMKGLLPPFGGRTFGETSTPLRIVATDFANGESVVLSEGALLDAIRASIAVPFVWKPWEIDGRLLCDGCLSAPMPVDVAIREGADVILTMGFEAEYPKRINSGLRFAFQVTSIYTNNLYRANYAFHNLAHHAEIIPVVPEITERVGLFDTDKIPYVVEQGERAAEEIVPYLRRVLAPASA